MKRVILIALIVLAVLFVLWALFYPTEADAHPRPCGPARGYVGLLERTHGETLSAIGVTTNGHRFAIVSSKTGTWSALVMNPNTRTACLLEAGDGFEIIKRPEPEGAPASWGRQ